MIAKGFSVQMQIETNPCLFPDIINVIDSDWESQSRFCELMIL